MLAALADAENELPMALCHAMAALLDQVTHRQEAMTAIESSLQEFNRRDTRSQRLQRSGGVGLITATAMSAMIGALDRYPSGRHFASALGGITPREHSSGGSRRLGRITKRGDTYLRMLLIDAARATLRSAAVARKKGTPLDKTHARPPPCPSASAQQGRGGARQQDRTTSMGRRSRVAPRLMIMASVSVPGTNKPIVQARHSNVD